MKSQLAGYRAARGRRPRPSFHLGRSPRHTGYAVPDIGWESVAHLMNRLFGYRVKV